jgi:OTU-like cysteine protease/RNA binding activity-knot of a chromodomain
MAAATTAAQSKAEMQAFRDGVAAGSRVCIKTEQRGWMECKVIKVKASSHSSDKKVFLGKPLQQWIPVKVVYPISRMKKATQAKPQSQSSVPEAAAAAASSSSSAAPSSPSPSAPSRILAAGTAANIDVAPSAPPAEAEAPPPPSAAAPSAPSDEVGPSIAKHTDVTPSLVPQDEEVPDIEVGSYVDVRDNVGKWDEAEIIKREDERAFVHFLNWDSKWDEWVNTKDEGYRFAAFRRYSQTDVDHGYTQHQQVYVCPPNIIPRVWVNGYVRKIDKSQLQVQYQHKGRKVQYWFHAESLEISPQKPSEESVLPDQSNDQWWKGQFIEVLDTTNKWLPAEVLHVYKNRVKVHYDGWSTRWDEWLDLDENKERVRKLGVALKKTDEEIRREEEEKKFRESLEHDTAGFHVLDVDKDGNCLFRAVAYQIYGTVDKHEELRQAVYDYMEHNSAFFSIWEEDFDNYVARQRNRNMWGGHVELVAMREMFNVDMQVYDYEHTAKPKPLDLESDLKLPLVRLSFHGKNHYNCVIDPNAKYPIGDDADTRISLRKIRMEQFGMVDEQPSPDSSGTGTGAGNVPDTDRKLSRATSAIIPLLEEGDFDSVWANADTENKNEIALDDAGELVSDLISRIRDLLIEKLIAAGQENEVDAVRKRSEEARGRIKYWVDMLAEACHQRATITHDEARECFNNSLSRALSVAMHK